MIVDYVEIRSFVFVFKEFVDRVIVSVDFYFRIIIFVYGFIEFVVRLVVSID